MKILMISRATLFSSPGGDTVQLMETAESLRKLGLHVDVMLADQKVNYTEYDLIHFFNVIRPSDILVHVRKSKLPYVVSTIFVDYSEADKSKGWFWSMINSLLGSDGIEYLKTIARFVKNGEKINSWEYLCYGHHRSVIKVIENAKMLFPNSESEYDRLLNKYRLDTMYHVVPNAVNKDLFSEVEGEKSRSGVICVARIEPRKNQLNLIRAMKNLPHDLILIGKNSPNHRKYYLLCKSEAGPNVTFMDQLKQEELPSFYSNARVHVLPSRFETTGLSSLEAAVCGCNIVVSPNGDTREYFRDQAFYCLPDDVESIRKAIADAYEAKENLVFKDFVRARYNWEEAAKETLIGYRMVLNEEKLM